MDGIHISTIIPTYNRAETVARSINSVLGQTYPVREIIVVDDGSTDGTRDVVDRIDSKKIRRICQANRGSAAARNTGLKLAEGDWVAFLDSDDLWRADKLARQVEIIRSHPEIDFVHTNRRLCWEKGQKDDGRPDVGLSEGSDKAFLFRHWALKTSTVLFRRKLLEGAGDHFREDLSICHDYELFWRLVLLSQRVGYVTEPLVDIYMSGDGLSRTDDMVKRRHENIAAMVSVLSWIDRQYPEFRHYSQILEKRIALEVRSLVENRFQTAHKKKIVEDMRFIISHTGKRYLRRIISQQLGKLNTSLRKHVAAKMRV